jgi:hypothetical protein
MQKLFFSYFDLREGVEAFDFRASWFIHLSFERRAANARVALRSKRKTWKRLSAESGLSSEQPLPSGLDFEKVALPCGCLLK